jgi:hypothetical protein
MSTQRSGGAGRSSRNASRSFSWNAAIEFLEARFGRAARVGALQPMDRQIEHSVSSGLKSPMASGFDPADGFAVEPAAGTLIGIGRIREAVADHPFAGGERRLDGRAT